MSTSVWASDALRDLLMPECHPALPDALQRTQWLSICMLNLTRLLDLPLVWVECYADWLW